MIFYYSIDHHYDPPAPYHVKSYCTAGIDTIKSNSISILSRVVLLLLGSLTGNYLHIKHFHYLPESGIFIILGAIFGKYFKAKRASAIAYMESTVVHISIPPPSFKPVSVSSPRSPLSKTPKQVFFLTLSTF